LFRGEIEKVSMVQPNFKDISATFKIMVKGSKSTDNGKEFLIMNSVILFRRLKGLGKVSNRVPSIEKVGLFQDSTSGKITGICYEPKGLGVVG